MYTLGYPREKLKKYKNSKKGTLYDELSDELCFKFKLDGDIYKRESYIIDGVSVHPDNLKELFIKENINSTIKFDNDNLLQGGGLRRVYPISERIFDVGQVEEQKPYVVSGTHLGQSDEESEVLESYTV
ncbi:hypothetical protein [Providencia hangzhouensis]